MTNWPNSRLGLVLKKLERHFGTPTSPHPTGPFEMILWEIVGYLADYARRTIAFETLRAKVGLAPAQILSAPLKLLREITRIGGAIAADDRAYRLRTAARLVVDEFGGNLNLGLKGPPQKAKKRLMQFPMIGEPGAENILLFAGVLPVLALESNGLRALVRLGFGEDRKSYSATYKSVREITMEQLPAGFESLIRARLLLRQHGQELCTRSNPDCKACPVASDCRFLKGAPALDTRFK